MEISTFRSSFQEQMCCLEKDFLYFPWNDRRAYGLFLKQTHEFCKHTPSLLLRCSSLLGHNLRIQKRFANHALEEWRHDELAVRDILNLGFNDRELPAFSVTRAFVQSQYYWIDHVDPLAFFGYILFLETLPATNAAKRAQETVQESFPDALSFGKVHQSEDPEHIESAWNIVNGFDENTLNLVHDNLSESISNYRLMLKLSEVEAEVH